MSPSGRSKRLEHRLNPIDRDVAAPHQLYLGFGQVNGMTIDDIRRLGTDGLHDSPPERTGFELAVPREFRP